ncbi:hypothetical protein FNV43_RR19213 [Rhamnella rubrinervis]|uniref:Uncharacterized protein n=1 Tax=Rhamnella rubrinervis TaxID=2594499 RepID=A0A8K0E0E5_9ROSA|nr:hypothetical protein FNV43_RR19213 [Rhamnella rubrinervis]
MKRREEAEGEDKGMIWKLPVVKSKHLGKVGPAFGIGAGCGIGFGVGLLGGAGFGPGIPGLQVGLGFGVGCGVGLGFGYGMGKGIAQDANQRYSNVGNLSNGLENFPAQEIGALMDELVDNAKKIVSVTSKELEKWRR